MTIVDICLYFGIFVFSVWGAIKARTYDMDIFGAFVLAFTISYGGGTLRDLLIGISPVNWVNDYLAFGMVAAAVIIAFLFKSSKINLTRMMFIAEAIGLGFFTVVGINRSLTNGVNEMYSVVMGVITAAFGGLLADIICNEPPNLLRRGELYATACAIGGIVYVTILHFFHDENMSMIACILTTVVLRALSVRKKLILPNI